MSNYTSPSPPALAVDTCGIPNESAQTPVWSMPPSAPLVAIGSKPIPPAWPCASVGVEPGASCKGGMHFGNTSISISISSNTSSSVYTGICMNITSHVKITMSVRRNISLHTTYYLSQYYFEYRGISMQTNISISITTSTIFEYLYQD